ncbi:DNA-binding protein YbaB [Saccharothrix tamanrassetensis]|uniref:DNA-binding protein YbaB n=1 Tax=Saccharothrix tamanrassetensis TaxID=1051531 RepID=A0A841CWQ4_9PSEU|nr:hypothetical protein [Saccharothrix tamanrassetensis]MBB5960385.1 DNA-binding protein YbaB [Saccharothrix tamanrassetensis]
MEDHYRFGFEEDDEQAAPAPRPTAAPGVTGQDTMHTVTVAVDPDANVLSVSLAPDWRRRSDLRLLHRAVTEAANAATAAALAERIGERAPATPPTPADDLSPIRPADALRLLKAVTADVREYNRRTTETANRPQRAESRGGHVVATARRGRLIDVTLDHNWLNAARDTEITAELREALARVRTAPEDLHSPAVTELQTLLADQDALLRRVGLRP